MLQQRTRVRLILLLAVVGGSSARQTNSLAQQISGEADNARQVVTFTTEQDHQQMMEQLGIVKLRPGPSGNPDAPNAANTDEAKANPYPKLPDLMTLRDGMQVTTSEQWWQQRRPEIVEDFEREVLGRVPAGVPSVTWDLLKTVKKKLGETDVIEKRLVGRVDNRECPEISVNILMTVVTPEAAQEPVPTLMMFSFFQSWGLDGEDLDLGGRFRGFGTREGGPPPPTQQLVEAGWGYASILANSIQDDSGGERQSRFGPPRPEGQTGGGLTRGIIGLTNKGQPRQPDQWGSLRAWAWGASRGLDYLESDPAIDAKRVGIEGVSRYGKAALVTMAFDPRFAMVLVGSSGEGGASLYRRNFGEMVENLTAAGEYHWMAGNFLKYGAEESSFGSLNASHLPVDAHMLIALCAPRPTFISYGIPERGDALWLDQQGSFMAAIAAQPAFRLLGARDLGRSDNYQTEQMPPVNTGLLEGELAWRQHDGGHTDAPNISHFVKWMEKLWKEKGVSTVHKAAGTPSRPRREVTWVNPEIPAMPGLTHQILVSESLGHDVGYVVWTPPNYDDSGQTRYPVVYFLHGAGGSEKSDSGGFSSRLSDAIQAGRFPPAICVFPNGGLSGYRSDVETMIVQELIPRIDDTYATDATVAGRVVCGFSMGGAGSVYLSLRHPELFCAAGSWGGALSFRGAGEESPLLQIAKENSQVLKANRFSLLTVNGDLDRPDGFKPLKQVCDALEIPHQITVLDQTDHNLGKYYERAGDDMLTFLAEQLKSGALTP